jgi:tripartite-type tricarboxylate transporter receptor subunit TctC
MIFALADRTRETHEQVVGPHGSRLALAAGNGRLPVGAQSYPSKTIRLVSPFPPGGSVDVVGRLLAAKLSETLGQQMVVGQPLGGLRVIGTES